ncbi:MAG: NAD-binding protein [Aliarcobacter sp.]|jgi:voltage-gated potassium channel|nr:NAD-binding protein [Aliarcobacter sp.]
MAKKVVIYGYTALGSKIANILNDKKYAILVVDFEESALIQASKDGFEIFESTLLNDNDLVEIGIDKDIDSLFCVSNSNKNNLFITLSARNLSKELKIITISKTKAEANKLEIAGATKVLNPNELGAYRIYRYMAKPLMLRVLDDILFSKSDLNISEIHIEHFSLLKDQFLKDMTIHKDFNILLLGIMDKEISDKFIFNTKRINHKIDEGDVLVVVGKNEDLENFSNYINSK